MRPHQKLDAWGKSVDLVVEVYKATERFLKEEKYGLTSQIRRAGCIRTGQHCRGCWAIFPEGIRPFSVQRPRIHE